MENTFDGAGKSSGREGIKKEKGIDRCPFSGINTIA